MLHRTYLPASIVERIIEATISGSDDPVIYSTPWINGRERGFSFWQATKLDRTVFVAEHRNSDSLTVSTFMDWDQITDTEYKAREFFQPSEYAIVAERVVELLNAKTPTLAPIM